MAGPPSDVPLQVLPVHAPAFREQIQVSTWAISTPGRPLLFLFNAQDGGFSTHDHVSSSRLTELPMQIAMWAGYLIPPGANPVILSWDIRLIVCKFPTNQQLTYSKTVWGRFPQTALQNPTFHFLISNIGTGNREIFPGGTIARGDIWNLWIKSKIADVNNTYSGNRWVSAGLFVYFTETNVLIP